MGCWRAPLAALFVAIKFPLIILLTTAGNALLNAMLAPLLGLNISLRQSFLAVSDELHHRLRDPGRLQPAGRVPGLECAADDAPTRRGRLAPTASSRSPTSCVIAFAGVAGNLRLVQLLRELSGKAATARRVLAGVAGGQPLPGQPAYVDSAPVHRLARPAGRVPAPERLPRQLLRDGFPLPSPPGKC